MPSSTTPARCQACASWRRRSSVSGTPMSLLRLPCVEKAASASQARRIEAIICVTVVLPLLPVTAISGSWKRRRQAAASSPQRDARVGHQQAVETGLGEALLRDGGHGARWPWPAAGNRARRSARPSARRTGRRLAACACRCARAGCGHGRRPPASSRAAARGPGQGSSSRGPSASARRSRLPRRRRNGASRPRSPGSPRGPCLRCSTTSAASACVSAWTIAARRSSISSTPSSPSRPATICARMAAGSSSRGLSLVTTTRSASRAAMAPISGRLLASRLPPQPNTHHRRPPRARASGCKREQAPSRAHRACARSRPRPAAGRRASSSRRAACGRAPALRLAHTAAASASDTPSARSPPITAEQVGDVVVADQRGLAPGATCSPSVQLEARARPRHGRTRARSQRRRALDRSKSRRPPTRLAAAPPAPRPSDRRD